MTGFDPLLGTRDRVLFEIFLKLREVAGGPGGVTSYAAAIVRPRHGERLRRRNPEPVTVGHVSPPLELSIAPARDRCKLADDAGATREAAQEQFALP
jgi:hypothetical protein